MPSTRPSSQVLVTLKCAALERVLEGDRGGLSADDGNVLLGLRLIFLVRQLRHGIFTRHKVDIHRTVCLRGHGLIYAIVADNKADAVDLPSSLALTI